MRIKNYDQLLQSGNLLGRRHALQIIEAGLQASDPYYNTLELFKLEGNKLSIGNVEFEANYDPHSGVSTYDINSFKHIYVVGAGKGAHRIAKAIEDVLGDHITDGQLICKHGDEADLSHIRVTYGNHPTPDAFCIEGCKEIVKIADKVEPDDLVITIIANGGSSLLTYPVEGVSLDDVVSITHLMQIEKGVPTRLLNTIRNHIDRLKGGKLARLFKGATAVHVAAIDIDNQDDNQQYGYEYMLKNNCWVHNMSEGSSFADAKRVLQLYDAWNECPKSIRRVIEEAKPENETVKYEEYKDYNCRIFGVMPNSRSFKIAAEEKARELGYIPLLLTDRMQAKACDLGALLGAIAISTEQGSNSIKTPAAIMLMGEMLVTKNNATGVGGRNQECMLSASRAISGSNRIVCASVDTDGTDGPGGFMEYGAPKCFSGAVVDGTTCEEAKKLGIEIDDALKNHSTSAPLWKLNSAIYAEQGISLNDLVLALIM